MSRTVRRVKIGKLYDGSSCCCCGELLFFGESPTHNRCWDRVNKCIACNSTATAAQIIGGIEVGLYVLYILAAIVARQ